MKLFSKLDDLKRLKMLKIAMLLSRRRRGTSDLRLVAEYNRSHKKLRAEGKINDNDG